MTAAHAEQVLAVYAEGIATGHATFQDAAPSWAEFDAGHLPDHRYVALGRAAGAAGTAGTAGTGPSDADGAPGADGAARHAPGADGAARVPGSPRVPDAVLGWAAVSPVSGRRVYAGVVELSLYVAAAARGRGVGRALLATVLDRAPERGVWTVQSGVFPENAASLALHEAAGFRVVGVRERLGLMTHGPYAGRWRDVLLLERRL